MSFDGFNWLYAAQRVHHGFYSCTAAISQHHSVSKSILDATGDISLNSDASDKNGNRLEALIHSVSPLVEFALKLFWAVQLKDDQVETSLLSKRDLVVIRAMQLNAYRQITAERFDNGSGSQSLNVDIRLRGKWR